MQISIKIIRRCAIQIVTNLTNLVLMMVENMTTTIMDTTSQMIITSQTTSAKKRSRSLSMSMCSAHVVRVTHASVAITFMSAPAQVREQLESLQRKGVPNTKLELRMGHSQTVLGSQERLLSCSGCPKMFGLAIESRWDYHS